MPFFAYLSASEIFFFQKFLWMVFSSPLLSLLSFFMELFLISTRCGISFLWIIVAFIWTIYVIHFSLLFVIIYAGILHY
jgi:hypothetical protein